MSLVKATDTGVVKATDTGVVKATDWGVVRGVVNCKGHSLRCGKGH